MQKAIDGRKEVNRRRAIQEAYNKRTRYRTEDHRGYIRDLVPLHMRSKKKMRQQLQKTSRR